MVFALTPSIYKYDASFVLQTFREHQKMTTWSPI